MGWVATYAGRQISRFAEHARAAACTAAHNPAHRSGIWRRGFSTSLQLTKAYSGSSAALLSAPRARPAAAPRLPSRYAFVAAMVQAAVRICTSKGPPSVTLGHPQLLTNRGTQQQQQQQQQRSGAAEPRMRRCAPVRCGSASGSPPQCAALGSCSPAPILG